MQTSFILSRASLILTVGFALPLHAQKDVVAPVPARTTPSEVDLRRSGQIATLAEAKPVLEQIDALKEATFQARRAARQKMQGRSDEEKTKIWDEVLAAEKSRQAEIRNLEAKVSEVRKQEWEKVRAAAKPTDTSVAPQK